MFDRKKQINLLEKRLIEQERKVKEQEKIIERQNILVDIYSRENEELEEIKEVFYK